MSRSKRTGRRGSAPPPRELTERDQEILREVILGYLLSAEPVSSREVSRHGRLGLSAASIRNVMADLEEWGFLWQPHSSSGRVPTPAAYHLFIDSLMRNRRLPARDRRYIEDNLSSGARDPEELIEAASHLLSEMSQQVSLVVTPALGQTRLRRVELVPLSGKKVLCVVVSTSGFIDNKIIETEDAVSREKLIRASNYLNENFGGQTLTEIRDRLLKLMAEERAKVDHILGLAIELAGQSLEAKVTQNVLVDGASRVLDQPELSDIGRVRVLFDTFSDKARLVRMLNECIGGSGVRVLIGEDSVLTSELDFSLVATTYGAGSNDEQLGTLGIFGPSRMEYERVIPLVHYLGETLSRLLYQTMA